MSRNPDLVEMLDVSHADLKTRMIFVFITETDYVDCDVQTEAEDIVDHLNVEADHELWGLFYDALGSSDIQSKKDC